MNKTKTLILAATLVLAGTLSLMQTTSASALSRAEQRECRDTWQGSWNVDSQKDENYKSDAGDCKTTNGGNCVRTERRLPDESDRRATVECSVDESETETNTGGSSSVTGGESINGCEDIESRSGTSIIKCDNSGNRNPIENLLLQIINFLAIGVGIAVGGGIIWGGIMYASSNGDSGKTKQAISIIVNAILALLLFMFMYAIINFLIPGGLFS